MLNLFERSKNYCVTLLISLLYYSSLFIWGCLSPSRLHKGENGMDKKQLATFTDVQCKIRNQNHSLESFGYRSDEFTIARVVLNTTLDTLKYCGYIRDYEFLYKGDTIIELSIISGNRSSVIRITERRILVLE